MEKNEKEEEAEEAGSRECSMHFRVRLALGLLLGCTRQNTAATFHRDQLFNDRHGLGRSPDEESVASFYFARSERRGMIGEFLFSSLRTSGLKPLISRAPLTHFVKRRLDVYARCRAGSSRSERAAGKSAARKSCEKIEKQEKNEKG